MKMKKVISSIMAFAMAATVVGSTIAPVTVKAEEVAAGEGPVITIWECNWGVANYEQALQKLAEQATAANINGKGYKVEVTMIPWDSYYDTFLSAYMGGTAPDIAWDASTSPMLYAGMNAVIDLQPIRDAWIEEGNPLAEAIPDTAWNFFQANGLQAGIPAGAAGQGLLYNKEMFEAAGITELPTTYETFIDAMQKLKDSGVTPFVYGTPFVGEPSHNAMEYFKGTNKAALQDLDGHATVDSEECMAVWNLYKTMIDNGYLPDGILQYSNEDATNAFLNGEVAILLYNTTNFIPAEDKDKYGALPLIMGPNVDTPTNTVTYQGYYAFDNGHNEDTLAVLKWWYENGEILWTEGGNNNIPCNPAIVDAVYSGDELAATFVENNISNCDVIGGFYPSDGVPEWGSAVDGEKCLVEVLSVIFTGGTVEEGVAKATEEINATVDRFMGED